MDRDGGAASHRRDVPSSLHLAARAAPILFVLIWATGFIVARLVAPHAEPLGFLVVRYALSAAVLALLAWIAGATWPRGVRGWRNALGVGILMQGIYLGGVFWAVRHGMPAGLSALIAGLQPLLTAVLARPLLGERVGIRRWAGILLGAAGASLVLLPGLGSVGAVPLPALASGLLSMVALTFGTIWQKAVGSASDLRTNLAAQFLGSLVVTLPIAALAEDGRLDGSAWQVWIGLLWAVLGLSVGAGSLLILLIRRGSVAGVASLLYLVPPVAAAMAWILFNERLAPVQMAGMALAALGVAVATRG